MMSRLWYCRTTQHHPWIREELGPVNSPAPFGLRGQQLPFSTVPIMEPWLEVSCFSEAVQYHIIPSARPWTAQRRWLRVIPRAVTG